MRRLARRFSYRQSAYHRRAASQCWMTAEAYTDLARSRFILLHTSAAGDRDTLRITGEVHRYTVAAATSMYHAHRHTRLALRYLRMADGKPRRSVGAAGGAGVIVNELRHTAVSTIYDEHGKQIGFTTAGDGADIFLKATRFVVDDVQSRVVDAALGSVHGLRFSVYDDAGNKLGEGVIPNDGHTDYRITPPAGGSIEYTNVIDDVHSTDPPKEESGI